MLLQGLGFLFAISPNILLQNQFFPKPKKKFAVFFGKGDFFFLIFIDFSPSFFLFCCQGGFKKGRRERQTGKGDGVSTGVQGPG